MPFETENLMTLSHGSRTAVVSFVKHFSGSTGTLKKQFYGVEGTDLAVPKKMFLPPGFDKFDDAAACAREYVGIGVSLKLATTLRHGTVLHHVSEKNKDGTPLRARVNGRLVTWKRRPGEWRLPMKYGMRSTFYIGTDTGSTATVFANPDNWTVAS